jgi:hypothetical protein
MPLRARQSLPNGLFRCAYSALFLPVTDAGSVVGGATSQQRVAEGVGPALTERAAEKEPQVDRPGEGVDDPGDLQILPKLPLRDARLQQPGGLAAKGLRELLAE